VTSTGDVTDLSVRELGRRLAARELSAVELAQCYLERIDERDPTLRAFITVDADYVLAQARAADRVLATGDRIRPLTGIPVALKDTIPTAGLRTTAGSRVLEGWVPDRDPPVVARLRSCGAVVIGKTNLHEFGYGGTSENEHFGAVRNPWDPARVAGGSSGGSAAAVAAGLTAVAVGMDAAGSVRIPACQCGTVGFKPTYGRVDTAGLIPLGWSLDHVGAIARTVSDAEVLQNAMNRTRTTSATLSGTGPPQVEGLRVGVPRDYAFAGVAPEVADVVRRALGVLASLGVIVTEVDVPGLELSAAAVYVILAGEVAAYHSRWWPRRAEDYGEDVRGKLEAAPHLSAGDYVQAQRVRAQIVASLSAALDEVDALATPSAPLPPQQVGQREVSFGGRQRPSTGGGVFIRMTAPFNLSGGPAVSVPCGRTPDGMPVGLQIASAPGRDELVLRLAAAYEHELGERFVPPEGRLEVAT
jgi:aspartyl-tRNA(Asn)/glutamyl-tRNA(Gln) amidotransferase subunit A